MSEDALRGLRHYGQSIWLDQLRRGLLRSGALRWLMEEAGVHGLTSNPAILQDAIAGTHDYDKAITMLARRGRSVDSMYQALVLEDIRQVADLFSEVYHRTEWRDGLVSLEVSPHLARATEQSVTAARQLWAAIGRPNAMIKIPGTPEGLPAIERLIAEGINVNVTLLFSVEQYRHAAEAYMAGLETRAARGQSLGQIASVASFFVSRIDSAVDPLLENIAIASGPHAALDLRGRAAIATARAAYQLYREIVGSARFRNLSSAGGRTQRLLWASTSTKNPDYSDVLYVDALNGPDTVTTLPLETLEAYRDHGQPAPRLMQGWDEAHATVDELSSLGIDLTVVAEALQVEGVEKFIVAYDRLMSTLRAQRSAKMPE